MGTYKGGLVPSAGVSYGANQQDEDVLSYSSTEQEASVHEPFPSQSVLGSVNLSFNNGMQHDLLCDYSRDPAMVVMETGKVRES